MTRREPRRVWFYPPELWWFGWATLSPFTLGHDEYARRVLIFGWVVTGRVCVAAWRCGNPECEEDRETALRFDDGGWVR